MSNDTTTKRFQVRQGDLLITGIQSMPKNLKLRVDADKNPSRIVEEGEATGHAHRITTGKVFDTPAASGNSYLDVKDEPAELTHDEHDTIDLPPGFYQVKRQREHVPKAAPRYVWD